MARRSFLMGTASVGVAACAGSSGAGAPGSGSVPSVKRPIPVRWGKDPAQLADLWLPARRPSSKPIGVVALIHGGFWMPGFDRTLMEDLARDLTTRGWAVWNMEYRKVGERGGWPATFLDVADGLDRLVEEAPTHHLDLDRVGVVGHSAGGTLALWTAGRSKLPAGAPGAGPRVRPGMVVSQAGVNNLVAGVFEDLGAGAVAKMMGSKPGEAMSSYRQASPAELLPLGVPQVLEYGTADLVVPPEQSTAYAAKAKLAGDDVTLIALPRANHFAVIDPEHAGWSKVVAQLATLLDR